MATNKEKGRNYNPNINLKASASGGNKFFTTRTSKDYDSVTAKKSSTRKKVMANISTTKKKPITTARKKTITTAKKKPTTTMNKNVKTDINLRQSTLAESFSRETTSKRLRPRKTARNYNESSLTSKSLSSDKQNSGVVIEQLDNKTVTKAPVYKTVRLSDGTVKTNDNIYDFQFDHNDPEEKTVKKKVKPAKRNVVAKNKKKKAVSPRAAENNDQDANGGLAGNKIPMKVNIDDPRIPNKRPQTPNDDTLSVTKEMFAVQRELSVEELSRKSSLKSKINVPTITGVEILTGNKKVTFGLNTSCSGQNSDNFNPFRVGQSVSKPSTKLLHSDTMDHSLLNKSLSPIKILLQNFDPSSPWRPPQMDTLYNVKKVFHSTPQANKNPRRQLGSKMFPLNNNNKIEEGNESDGSTDAEGRNKISPVRTTPTKVLQPFGSRTSNLENIQVGKSCENLNFATAQTAVHQSTTNFSKSSSSESREISMMDNEMGNKENIPSVISPIKSPILKRHSTASYRSPGLKRALLLTSGSSPRKTRSKTVLRSPKDNGTDSPKVTEPAALTQANLHSFLNLDEVAEGSRIGTPHGIFSDIHSTPVNTKPLRKLQTEPNVDNCFGFEDDSAIDMSPITVDKQLTENVVQQLHRKNKKPEHDSALDKNPVRISIGEIKRTLLPKPRKQLPSTKKDENKGADKIEPIKNTESSMSELKLNQVPNPAQFIDTFDVLEDQNEACQSTQNDIMLFADMEPVHFTEPPRWSYVKKRERKRHLSFGNDNSEQEENYDEQPVSKKKKSNKLSKKQNNAIDQWIKSVNDTFQEIDKFDLLVEKQH